MLAALQNQRTQDDYRAIQQAIKGAYQWCYSSEGHSGWIDLDDFERIGNVNVYEGTLFLKLRERIATVHRQVYDCLSLYKHPS